MSKLVGDFLDTRGRNRNGWELMRRDNDVDGGPGVREGLEDFTFTALERRLLGPGELAARLEVHSTNSFLQFEKISLPEVRRRQVGAVVRCTALQSALHGAAGV